MTDVIQPRVLKGFRDFLPSHEIPRRKLIRALEDHFVSCGFVPIDTPALEYTEVLLSKGGGETDKQTYRFTDHGGRDVAMRFDLTVPFARFVAAHRSELTMPFKRYHIGKVWRGENTQRGRYREFVQCDFDIVGTDSAAADLEIMLMMSDGMRAVGAGETRIRFNHRGLFNLLLARLGLEGRTAEVLRTVDKLGKVGPEEVRRLLADIAGDEGTSVLLDFIAPSGTGGREGNRATLEKMLSLAHGAAGYATITGERTDGATGSSAARGMGAAVQSGGSADSGSGSAGSDPAARLRILLDAIEQLDLSDTFVLDPSITRGLDYYTGIVFETFLTDLPALGSVCSGGRYDNLTGLFMKEPVTGVGASIGLDRLMAGMEELGRLEKGTGGPEILILMLDEALLPRYQDLARRLRAAGLSAEVYPEPKKLPQQFKYAEARGCRLALIIGTDEAAAGRMNLKDLKTRESRDGLTADEAVDAARELLTGR